MANNYEFSPISRDDCCCRLSRRSWVCLCLGLLVLVACAVAIAAALMLSQAPTPAPVAWEGKGATDNLFAIVLGRCYSYTQLVRPDLRHYDCAKILDAFKNAFISKNPCNITKEDYEPLLHLVNQTVPCNKTLFWSKSKELAHQYTAVQSGVFTLEDTLLGYLGDNLMWCGDAGSVELNHQSCPRHKNECLSNGFSEFNSPVLVFWRVISQKFAESACGVVQVMLNGSLSEPFSQKSTFGGVEVYNLDPRKVHKVQAWVMHDIGQSSRDSCSSLSMAELKSIVNKRNITFDCHDNYRPARFVQCVKYPEHASCASNI